MLVQVMISGYANTITLRNRMHQIKVHSDLIAGRNQFNAWRASTSFDIADLTKPEVNRLSESSIIEHVFSGVGPSREEILFNQKFRNFIAGMKKIVYGSNEGNNRSVYLFAAEHKAHPPSRIRSYKGLAPSQWKGRINIQERELAISEQLTLLVFIANLSNELFDEASKFFMDDARSFIISTSRKETIDQLLHVDDFINTKGNVQVNYAKLLLKLSPKDLVYRVGGNKGEDYWSVQEFVAAGP